MERFLYGAGYYPLMHSKEDWKKDLDIMKDCNINIVRTAELFNTWDQIEPEREKFNFKFLDEFFDECYSRGIKILLGTGTASPPYWLHELDPEINILNNKGQRYPNNVSYSWACYHNPTYIKESERYIKTIIERYKKHPALHAYQIHNEIGYPFMPLSGNDLELYCYCEHTKNEFRKWVKEKYKTLDNLNKAWTWSATNIYHTSWEVIEPPYAKPTSWSSVTRWLDFRLFLMDSITNFVKWQNELIKKYDTTHPTCTNIFFMKGQDKMGVLTAIDQFEIAKNVDYIGYDLYPGSGNKLDKTPEFSSMFLDHARSISRPLGKNYWLLEIESGPINGWALGPNRNTNSSDIERYIYEAIAHDAKFTLYQGYRQWDFQPLQWGGLVDLDGNITGRTVAAKKMGDLLKENSDFLMNANTDKGDIAILISKENAIICNGMGHEEFLVNSIRGAYRILWEKGFNVDFITPEHLEKDYCKDYKAIMMPFMLVVDKEISDRLASYVMEGGILIGSAKCGFVNESGWYNHSTPCFGLKNVFGVEVKETWANIEPKITYNKKNYDGYWHKEKLDIINPNTEILARFFDDTAAITLNRYGNGIGIYIATQPEIAFLDKKSYILWDVLSNIFKVRSIEPQLDISYSNRFDREIDGHVLKSKDMTMIIITHYLKNDRNDLFISGKKLVTVSLKLDYMLKEIYDYHSKEKINYRVEDNYIKFDTFLNKYQTKVLVIK